MNDKKLSLLVKKLDSPMGKVSAKRSTKIILKVDKYLYRGFKLSEEDYNLFLINYYWVITERIYPTNMISNCIIVISLAIIYYTVPFLLSNLPEILATICIILISFILLFIIIDSLSIKQKIAINYFKKLMNLRSIRIEDHFSEKVINQVHEDFYKKV